MTDLRDDTMTETLQRSRLRRVLLANGGFSLTSGATMLVAAAYIEDRLGAPAWVLIAVGLVLVPYGVGLWRASRATSLDRRVVWAATAADLAWVAGAAAVIVVPGTMSVAGKWVLAGLTIVVLDFALVQLSAVRRDGLVPTR